MKIVVLGMHRSGTSLACGLLNLAGVHFGEENELIQPNEENPKGFWERKDVRKLNDGLLHEMGCDWSELSNLYKKEIPGDILDDFYSDARVIVNNLQQQSSSGVIGLKEPRLCLLMPFWQNLLDEKDFILLVHRDPEEIAISLKNRNGIPDSVSNYLTERYLGYAIQSAKGRLHHITSFKDLIERPVQSLKNIITAINATGLSLDVPDETLITEYSSPSLYRSKATGEAYVISKRLQRWYDRLGKGELSRILSTETPTSKAVLSYQHSKRFEEYSEAATAKGHLEKRINTLEGQVSSNLKYRDKLKALNAELSTANQELNKQKQNCSNVETILSERTSSLEELKTSLAQSNQVISGQKEQIADVKAEIKDRITRTEELISELAQSEQIVTNKKELLTEVKAELKDRIAHTEELSSALAQSNQLITNQREQIAGLRSELGKQGREISALSAELGEKLANIEHLNIDLKKVSNQLADKNQKLVIRRSRQKQWEHEVARFELATDEANQQARKLAETNQNLEQALQNTQSHLAISDNITNKLQLLHSSYTWRISRRFIAFMLRPLRFGTGPTVLDEIDRDIEEFRQWNPPAILSGEPGKSETTREVNNPVTASPDLSEQKPDISALSAKRTLNVPNLYFSGDRKQPVKAGLVVTEDSETTSAGDFFTARELAKALHGEHGWDCVFLPEHSNSTDWHDVGDLDILLVLLDKYDLSKLHGHTKPVIKVAWVRNWVDRWTLRPWFQSFDLVLCTSEIARQFIYEHTGKAAHLLKIGANTERFHPSIEMNVDLQSDYCFSGNYWGAPRQIERLDPTQLPFEFALFGKGWDQHEQFAGHCRGNLPYDELPTAYASTKILVDDANHVTKPWASVNSRVFEALATGTLVITNGIDGARETFGSLLPTYSTQQGLEHQLRYFLDHPNERERLARKLQLIVARDHSYINRAGQFKEILSHELNARARIAIKLPIQCPDEAITESVFQFGKGLAKALRKLGYSVRFDFIPDWYSVPPIPDDVIIAIHGRSIYKPGDSELNLLWITHQSDQFDTDACDNYDSVFVASEIFANKLRQLSKTQVVPLPSCTDPELFSFDEDLQRSKNIVFVGDSDGICCQILDDAISAGLKPMVVGKNWEGVIEESLIAGKYIDSEALPQFYASSGVVLCHHEPGVTGNGFIPSQLFDAVACGAVPVCQTIPCIKGVFGDLVYQYSTSPGELQKQVEEALAEPSSIKTRRMKLAREISQEHSFEARVRIIDSIISSNT